MINQLRRFFFFCQTYLLNTLQNQISNTVRTVSKKRHKSIEVYVPIEIQVRSMNKHDSWIKICFIFYPPHLKLQDFLSIRSKIDAKQRYESILGWAQPGTQSTHNALIYSADGCRDVCNIKIALFGLSTLHSCTICYVQRHYRRI